MKSVSRNGMMKIVNISISILFLFLLVEPHRSSAYQEINETCVSTEQQIPLAFIEVDQGIQDCINILVRL